MDFGATKTVGEIDVYTRQDDYINLVEPTATQTFSLYGVTAYDVQYWTGTAWATVPGGSVTNNNLVWRKFTFTPVTTQKIRVVVNAGADNVYSRLVEVEAYAQEQPGGQGEVKWLVTDHLGTPRMVADLSGSLAGIKRHDYLPFGEEIGAGVGGRTAGQGYVADTVRQQFTGYERDDETGLDFAQARYYASIQGRFASVDPLMSSASISDPQSFNRYVYVSNNPLSLTDPTGLSAQDPQKKKCPEGSKCDSDGNIIIITGAAVNVIETLPKTTAYPNTTPVIEGPGVFSRIFSGIGRGVVRLSGVAGIILLNPTEMGCSTMDCYHSREAARLAIPNSADAEVDTSANLDPEDLKPDTSENTDKGGSESRDARKVNKKRVASAKEQIEQLRKKLAEVISRPNKTPADKKERAKLEAAIRKQLDRTRKSEPHGRRGK